MLNLAEFQTSKRKRVVIARSVEASNWIHINDLVILGFYYISLTKRYFLPILTFLWTGQENTIFSPFLGFIFMAAGRYIITKRLESLRKWPPIISHLFLALTSKPTLRCVFAHTDAETKKNCGSFTCRMFFYCCHGPEPVGLPSYIPYYYYIQGSVGAI